MAKDNLETVLRLIFGHEGGFTDDPKDPGNWSSGKIGVGFICGTKYGITGKTLGNARGLGRSATLAEVKALTREEADVILRKQYADPIRFQDLPIGVSYAVLDYAVNSGPVQAVKDLQREVGAKVDGYIGINTINAVKAADPEKLINGLSGRRLAFMRSLKNWKTYGEGWAVRVERVRSGAVAMAKETRPVLLVTPPATVVASSAPALPEDVSVLKTAKGKLGALAGLGAAIMPVVQAVSSVAPDATAKLSPYFDIPGVKLVASSIAVLGVFGLIGAALKKDAAA